MGLSYNWINLAKPVVCVLVWNYSLGLNWQNDFCGANLALCLVNDISELIYETQVCVLRLGLELQFGINLAKRRSLQFNQTSCLIKLQLPPCSAVLYRGRFGFLSIMVESDFLNRELCTNCCLWDSATKKKIPRFARHSFFRVKIPQTRFIIICYKWNCKRISFLKMLS